MTASLSFLHSAFPSTQQLLLRPQLNGLTSSPRPSLVVEAKAKTRREDRTARHIRIRKKVVYTYLPDSLLFIFFLLETDRHYNSLKLFRVTETSVLDSSLESKSCQILTSSNQQS